MFFFYIGLSITYDQILKPFPIIRSNSVSNTSPMGICKKEHYKNSISTSLLFSTAVITGSTSAPDLKDVLNQPESLCKAVPSCNLIRPLETLHNALSLKQMDDFLFKMTSIDLARKNEQNRKTSTESKLSITNLIEQPITKINTISSSSTLTSNLSDICGSNEGQLQVLSGGISSSGPSSIISSSSMPSSPNNNSNLKKLNFFGSSSTDQSENELSSFSGPPSPSN